MVTSIQESSCFRTPFQSQSVHLSQTLLKASLQPLYPNFPLTYNKWSWKTSLLLRFKILGPFGKTFMADHMYSHHEREKFQQQVQMLSSQWSKKFPRIFIAIFQSTQNFGHFERKDQLHSLNILKILTSRNLVTSMPESSCFRTPFQSQSVHFP